MSGRQTISGRPRPTARLDPAEAGHDDAIAAIWHQGWIDGHAGHVPASLWAHRQLADFRERVPARRAATTAAVVAGGVVGFVIVHDDEVEQLYVARSARGTGVATLLLRHGVSEIAGTFDAAWLAVAAGNARARRFYEHSGWTDRGPFDYPAFTTAGPIPVRCHRYETSTRSSR